MNRGILKSRFLCFIALLLIFPVCESAAKIYKYKNSQGAWVYSDRPVGETIAESSDGPETRDVPRGQDLESRLLENHDPKNEVEKAVLATVAIQSPFGFGSGFFISDQGHIITNKHVIRKLETDQETADKKYAQLEIRFKEIEARIFNEEQRLKDAKDELDDFKRYIDGEDDSPTKAYNVKRYQASLARYKSWLISFETSRKSYESKKKELQNEQSKRRYDTSVAQLNTSFTVYIADNTSFYAHLVSVSKEHDLALLKLDGYKTPCLVPADNTYPAQGDPVFAIGNPVKLRNSVTSGVVSGYEGTFVKTNAQIYPGNSGGPLVAANGQVLGVNTFKHLTRKFEGLGFAISIQVVMDEFGLN